MANIVVLGAGGFGLSLAIMCSNIGHDVTCWSTFQSEIDDIKRDGENKLKLPGAKVPESVKLTTDISVVSGADVVLFGVPTPFVRGVAKEAAPHITAKTILVNTSKGLEMDTLKRMSVVISEEIPNNYVVVLTGPSHAEEVARSMPTTIVAACDNPECSKYIQNIFASETLRIYVNNDVIGCEIGGALKNIIALCAGICDGAGFGDNTKAALMTRGIVEIARLGEALGAKRQTFSGLTGVGDLIVTCTSMHSRNRRAGILIGQGIDPQDAVKQIGTVEGYICSSAAYQLAKQTGVNMPITEQLHDVLWNGKSVTDALKNLMIRPKCTETEETFLI